MKTVNLGNEMCIVRQSVDLGRNHEGKGSSRLASEFSWT